MYGTASRSGTSSASTPHHQQRQQQLLLHEWHEDADGVAFAQRPSTRRGGRPGSNSQSGGSGAGGSGGGTVGMPSADGSRTGGERSSASNASGGSAVVGKTQQQNVVMDVWTRRNSSDAHRRLKSSGGSSSSSSASSSALSLSASSSALSSAGSKRRSLAAASENNASRSSNPPPAVETPAAEQPQRHTDATASAYPELSEPEHYYTDEQFDSEDEEHNNGAGGGGTRKGQQQEAEQFTKRFQNLLATSQRTRSLREPLHSAVVARQEEATAMTETSPPSAHARADKMNFADRGQPLPTLSPPAHFDASPTLSRKGSSTADGSASAETGDRGTPTGSEHQKALAAPFVSRLSSLRHQQQISTGRQSVENDDGTIATPKKAILVQKTPLGFGSSSSRGFILSASGSSKEHQRRPRNASAPPARPAASGEDSATYKAWLRQKLEADQARRQHEADQRKNEADNQAEKKRLAEMNFERWKRELDKRIAARKAAEKRATETRAERQKRAKEEQKAIAEKTFEHWKRAEEQRLRRQHERTKSALMQRQADEQQRKEAKRTEAETAYQEWVEQQNVRLSVKARAEREHAQQKERDRRDKEAKAKQLAQEAYELWTRMKAEERHYKQSLAFRILDFERQASQHGAGGGFTPWLPTSPSTPSKIRRPPPEQAQGRRRTLERRRVLPFTRLSSADSKGRGRQAHVPNAAAADGAPARRSASSTRRAWR